MRIRPYDERAGKAQRQSAPEKRRNVRSNSIVRYHTRDQRQHDVQHSRSYQHQTRNQQSRYRPNNRYNDSADRYHSGQRSRYDGHGQHAPPPLGPQQPVIAAQ